MMCINTYSLVKRVCVEHASYILSAYFPTSWKTSDNDNIIDYNRWHFNRYLNPCLFDCIPVISDTLIDFYIHAWEGFPHAGKGQFHTSRSLPTPHPFLSFPLYSGRLSSSLGCIRNFFSVLNDLWGGSTSMDVDVDSVEFFFQFIITGKTKARKE